ETGAVGLVQIGHRVSRISDREFQMHAEPKGSASRNSPRPAQSEWNVVVEIVRTGLAAARVLVLILVLAAPACLRRAPAAETVVTDLAAAAEHLHFARDDVGRVVLLAFLVVARGAQAALDVDLRTLAQVLAGNLGEAPEEHHPVP